VARTALAGLAATRYDFGMTAAKIAITIPEEQLAQVRRAVRSGRAESVSAYIAKAVAQQGRETSLRTLVQDLVREHGEPTQKDKTWARRVLKRKRKA
jgi:Arc/MetJ-type ribon-helix-helix transcriptional regulator